MVWSPGPGNRGVSVELAWVLPWWAGEEGKGIEIVLLGNGI